MAQARAEIKVILSLLITKVDESNIPEMAAHIICNFTTSSWEAESRLKSDQCAMYFFIFLQAFCLSLRLQRCHQRVLCLSTAIGNIGPNREVI